MQPTKVQFRGSALKCIKIFSEHVTESCLRKFGDDRPCLAWLSEEPDKGLHF